MIERTFGGKIWMLTANELVWGVGSFLGGVFVSVHGAFRDKTRVIALACFGGSGTVETRERYYRIGPLIFLRALAMANLGNFTYSAMRFGI